MSYIAETQAKDGNMGEARKTFAEALSTARSITDTSPRAFALSLIAQRMTEHNIAAFISAK